MNLSITEYNILEYNSLVLHVSRLYTSKIGIAAEKLLFLDYFVIMPWPIINFEKIAYFQEIYYLGHLYEPDTVPLFILIKSVFFSWEPYLLWYSVEERKFLWMRTPN